MVRSVEIVQLYEIFTEWRPSWPLREVFLFSVVIVLVSICRSAVVRSGSPRYFFASLSTVSNVGMYVCAVW